MKFIANPVTVDAFVIEKVGDVEESGKRMIDCSENKRFFATPEMLARIEPKPGDYFVVQSDNYVYMNPKDVFERKYRAA
ncbi:MAG TPA: hypothetical protein VNT29_11340 [Candidatus Limnocylindrales bacterium]|nr:hypothetical protein [Candidatus Limnocylindrales bacterium]